jgi:hypothetical protein
MNLFPTFPQDHWVPWASLGGIITTDPTVEQNADGSLEVFARGTDNALWHIRQISNTNPNNSWSDWVSLGGGITSNIAVPKYAISINVFARGTDNALWHRWKSRIESCRK